jgi:hypothetical protein
LVAKIYVFDDSGKHQLNDDAVQTKRLSSTVPAFHAISSTVRSAYPAAAAIGASVKATVADRTIIAQITIRALIVGRRIDHAATLTRSARGDVRLRRKTYVQERRTYAAVLSFLRFDDDGAVSEHEVVPFVF